MAANRESSADVLKRAIRNLGTVDSHELYQCRRNGVCKGTLFKKLSSRLAVVGNGTIDNAKFGTLDHFQVFSAALTVDDIQEKTELSEFGEHIVVGVCYTWPAMHHQHSLTLLQRCPIHAWPLKLVPKEHVHAAENWNAMQLPRTTPRRHPGSSVRTSSSSSRVLLEDAAG
mmetsp:Transcript_95330/g.168437  ORF Transcript_95330/g.168437 Transcript_95330/m.168437 type:complete len:171 (-) Transcript_95330:65-577(-)